MYFTIYAGGVKDGNWFNYYEKKERTWYHAASIGKKLHVSNQAVSKWENGMTCPEISLLPAIAKVFGVSVDSLLGYQSPILSDYEKRYQEKGYYWGIKPNDLCYEILKLKPPIKPLKILDVGCGEGKDAVFLARNGYHVSAFDLAETGVEKGKALASQHGVYVDFFTANIEDMQLCMDIMIARNKSRES